MSKNPDIFNKTNRNDRLKQMSQQQQLIEEKKRQIQKKIEDQRRKEAEEALRASKGDQPGSDEKNNPNVFSNDGSFLDQFRKIANREGNDNQELKRSRDRSRSPINRNDMELHTKPFQQIPSQFQHVHQRQILMPQSPQRFQPQHQFQHQRQQLLAMASVPPPPPPPPMIPPQNIPAPSPLIPQTIPPPSPLNPHSIPPPKPLVPQSIPPPVPPPVMNVPPANYNLPPALLTVPPPPPPPPPLPFNPQLAQVLSDNRGYAVLPIPQPTQSASTDFSQPPPITGVPPVSDQRNYPFPNSTINALPKPEDCSYPLASRNLPAIDTEAVVRNTTSLTNPLPPITDVKNHNTLPSGNNEKISPCEDKVKSVLNDLLLDTSIQPTSDSDMLNYSQTDCPSPEKFHPSSLPSSPTLVQQSVTKNNLTSPTSNISSSACGISISQTPILLPQHPLLTAVPADNIQGNSERNLCKIEVKNEPEDPEEDSKSWFTDMEKLKDFKSVPFIEAVKSEVKKEEPSDIQATPIQSATRPERKRKSRWGDSTITETAATPTISVPPSTAPKIKVPGMSGYMISKVTRTDPGLLQYTRTAYGSTNLSEEDWKKAEDNYKVHLLYQDMMAKREQVERLRSLGKNKYEYDSDEETDGGTWEHKLREKEMDATKQWAESLTEMAKGKHHIGDFLPPDELKRFMDKYSAVKGAGEPDLSDYKEFKLKEDNKGFQMLQKLGWTEGQGLGSDGGGILDPINKAQSRDHQGLGLARPGEVTSKDDEYDAYRKRMMLAYRFRPNPLNNPRRPYY